MKKDILYLYSYKKQTMSQTLDNNKRIAKNTLILYVRMLFTVGISFYSTRLILANLGVENYGIEEIILKELIYI